MVDLAEDLEEDSVVDLEEDSVVDLEEAPEEDRWWTWRRTGGRTQWRYLEEDLEEDSVVDLEEDSMEEDVVVEKVVAAMGVGKRIHPQRHSRKERAEFHQLLFKIDHFCLHFSNVIFASLRVSPTSIISPTFIPTTVSLDTARLSKTQDPPLFSPMRVNEQLLSSSSTSSNDENSIRVFSSALPTSYPTQPRRRFYGSPRRLPLPLAPFSHNTREEKEEKFPNRTFTPRSHLCRLLLLLSIIPRRPSSFPHR